MFHMLALAEFELCRIREQGSVCSSPIFQYAYQEKK